MTLAQLNAADRPAFVEAVGFAFEHSPWIAEAAWERRPFANVSALYAAMWSALDEASQQRRVALIAAHPDLAGRLAREGRLTSASHDEQADAGLDHLTPSEVARFDELNHIYRSRFGFPFVICARENTKATILAALEARARNERDVEMTTALWEIGKIARVRLEDAVSA